MKCFEFNKKNKSQCEKKNCRYWLKSKESNNCCINYNFKEKITLEEIGKIFGVTRMRICQIEKTAISKLKENIKKMRR
jgi:DNA-directed RNA polymerase sigma subunit (sigma70/sigma32)